jgi:hypothetical protein
MDKTAFLTPSKINGPYQVAGLGDVWVKEVPAEMGGYIHQSDSMDNISISLRIVIASVCNEDGTPVFTCDDLNALRKAPVTRVSKLMQLAVKHSGFGDEVEAVAGNL